MKSIVWTTAALTAILSGGAMAQETDAPSRPHPVPATEATLADSEALAALENPGKIIFRDDFESAASLDNYFEIRGLDDHRAQLVEDPALARAGSGAIQFRAPANQGNESGAGASLWFGPDGYDVVYFRRYIRFAADYDQGNMNHTGGGLSGVAGSNKWGGMGQAGIRPQGDDRFTSSFEPWRDWQRYPPPGYMFLYTYWMDMQKSNDGNYWGNFIEAPENRRVVLERDRWYCLEQMIRVNDIGRTNGELAAWIDGRLYIHYTDFRWRISEDLRIKRAGFGIYIHQAAKDNVVWYDDVVLSTGYIGPLAEEPTTVDEEAWGDVKSQRAR